MCVGVVHWQKNKFQKLDMKAKIGKDRLHLKRTRGARRLICVEDAVNFDINNLIKRVMEETLTLTFISEQKLKYITIVYIKITCLNRMYNKFDNS